MVQRLLSHYKSDLVKVIKELRLPYNIEVLTQIRRDCYHQHFNDPNSLQNNQVHVSLNQYHPAQFCPSQCFFSTQQIAQEAQSIFFQHIPKPQHYQPMEHTTIKQEEFIFQVPIQGTNISVMQPGVPDQMINYTPIVHTIPAQTDGYIYDVDAATPLLILTPVTSMNATQITSSENPPPAPVIEIPLHSEVLTEVSEIICFSTYFE